MVNAPIQNSGAQTTQVRIESSALAGRIAPTINVGDVLRLNVRQNNGGKGLLYYQGIMIKAQIPPELAVGDKMLAQVQQNGEAQVLLKILDVSKSTQPQALLPRTAVDQLSQQLTSLIQNSKGPLFQSASPMPLAAALAELPAENLAKLEKVFSSLQPETGLPNASQALKQLRASVDGSLVTTLKEAAESLRSLAEKYVQTPAERTLNYLRTELTNLLEQEPVDRQFVLRQVDKLIDGLRREIGLDGDSPDGFFTKFGTHTDAANRKRGEVLFETLGRVLEDLKQGKSDKPEALRRHLEAALRQLDTAEVDQPKQQTDSVRSAADLLRLASRLDQLAASQESLNQLNPLMHALGEPALVLFPFLFQGLLSHSEVTIDPYRGGRKSGQNRRDDEDGEKGDATPYQRVQVSVPLPQLGTIDVDVAHRDKEILVRLTADDPEIVTFLEAQFENLAAILHREGFERSELTAHLGRNERTAPHWIVRPSGTEFSVA